jgi:hypothetical protein
LLAQTGGAFLGADQEFASSGAGEVTFGNGSSLTAITLGNGTATVAISAAGAGAAAKYVCADSSNRVVLQAGAC